MRAELASHGQGDEGGSESGGSDAEIGETVGDVARDMADFGREAVRFREAMFAGIPMAERRQRQEQLWGKSFVAKLRRADDWAFEAMLHLGDGDDDGDTRRAVFCLQVAQMTDSCHGALWPHLKFEILTQRAEEFLTMMLGLIAQDGSLRNECEAANSALAINEASDAKPPRKTGIVDLGALQEVPAPTSGSVAGLKGSLLVGGLPAFVCVERIDGVAAVALRLGPTARRDARGGVLVEVAFMFNMRESIRKRGSLEMLSLEALTEELGIPLTVSCDGAELDELLKEFRANSAQLSVESHMHHREAFALGATGEEAVHNRVVREPLEVSFLRVSEPPSRMMEFVLDDKAKGNSQFAAGKLADALTYYEHALRLIKDCEPKEVGTASLEESKVHANRAECFLRHRKWQSAVDAATAALDADSRNVKALFRRAKADQGLGDSAAAIADVRAVVHLEPRNQQARALLRELHPLDAAKASYQQPLASSPSADDGAESSVGLLAAFAWARGLSLALQYERLVDCYRLRVDDDYAWGGGELRGFYSVATGGGGSIWQDFLVFCKLAVRRHAIPQGWDWSRFLSTATGLLRYAFEKSDAQEKYGGENVFAVAMGGRSLRYTGEVIYGSSAMAMDDSDEVEELEEAVRRSRGRVESLFDDVGGAAVWHASGLLPRRPDVSRTAAGPACWHFQQGRCSYGDRCRFRHVAAGSTDSTARAPQCRFWLQGECKFGEHCRFSHGLLPAAGDPQRRE